MQEPELIAKTLRAVLHPFKNGIPLSELQSEYRSLTGEWIPFRQLGHGTLEGYLESIPRVVRMEGNKMGEVRISYSSEMAFVFVKSAWIITLLLDPVFACLTLGQILVGCPGTLEKVNSCMF